MKNDQPLILINGIASIDLKSKLPGSFRRINTDNILILFCDYSEYDIPIGSIFSCVQKGNDVIYSGNIVLLSVTQEFFSPFDYIPKGWKTICELEFKNGIPVSLKNQIPIIDNWYNPNKEQYRIF
jgi:hypothetical protein